jgi:DNA-3-methyladenine glycosylase II
MTAPDSRPPIASGDPQVEAGEAHQYLLGADARLARLVAEQGPVDFRVWHDSPFALHEGDLFEGLALHIVSQQISTASAAAIFGRLAAFCGGRIAAEPLAAASRDDLRAVGLSHNKSRTLVELGARVTSGTLDLAALRHLTDTEAQERLVALWGIGPWSAQMFLLLNLQRPDVFPAGDVALRVAIAHLDELASTPDVPTAADRAVALAPFRSYAAAHLWRSVAPPRRDPEGRASAVSEP